MTHGVGIHLGTTPIISPGIARGTTTLGTIRGMILGITATTAGTATTPHGIIPGITEAIMVAAAMPSPTGHIPEHAIMVM